MNQQKDSKTAPNSGVGVDAIVRPPIVCLCGSTRFMEAFQRANLQETLAGKIVLSIGCNTKSDTDLMAAGELTEELKHMLDELHKRKIDLADEVLVLNVGGYIGTSTSKEIRYAHEQKKPIRYLESAFECSWCKLANLSKEEYTLPVEDIGGWDNETGLLICQDCRDAAAQAV